MLINTKVTALSSPFLFPAFVPRSQTWVQKMNEWVCKVRKQRAENQRAVIQEYKHPEYSIPHGRLSITNTIQCKQQRQTEKKNENGCLRNKTDRNVILLLNREIGPSGKFWGFQDWDIDLNCFQVCSLFHPLGSYSGFFHL